MKSFSPQYSWNPSTYTPEEKEQERKTSELMIRKAAGGWDTDGERERAMGVTPIGQLEDDENSLGAGRRLRGGNPRVGNGVSPPGSFKIGQQCRTLGGVT